MRRKIKAVMVCLISTLFVASTLCLTACKGKAQKAKVETVEGVTLIHNPATPLHPTRAVVLDEEFAYKEKDETGEVRLFNPGRVAVDAGGNVYIADETDMAIKVFDPQGKFLHAIGRKGEGPGEFTYIFDMVPLPDGRLLVTDFRARRTSFFDSEGQFLVSYPWKKNFLRVYLATGSSCTLEEGVYTEEARERWIKTIDFAGEELISFGKFSFPEFKMIRAGEVMISISVPWTPASIFAGDNSSQWLYHCPGDQYLIEVYDQKGKLFRKIDRPYEPVPVTDEDINEIKSRVAQRPESPAAKLYAQMEFPKVKPLANHMIVDSDGYLWVRTSEVKKEGEKENTAYDIFNPDGYYETRVWIDVIPSVLADGKMYLTDEDEATGMRQVKRYRIIWKES
jgi:hypothetical protein